MTKKEYIRLALKEIRYKNVREVLQHELSANINDSADSIMNMGAVSYVTPAEAEEAAVAKMGDPAEKGRELNSLHRFRYPVNAVICALLLMIMGILIKKYADPEYFDYSYKGRNFFLETAAGMSALLIFSLTDYTALARFPKTAWGIFIGLFGLTVKYLSEAHYGYKAFLLDMRIAEIDEPTAYVFYGALIGVPLSCGLIYSQRTGNNPQSLIKGVPDGITRLAICYLVTMLPLILICRSAHCFSGEILSWIWCAAVLCKAVKEGHFGTDREHLYEIILYPLVFGVIALSLTERIIVSHDLMGDAHWYSAGDVRYAVFHSGLTGMGYGDLLGDDDLMLTEVIIRFGLPAGLAVTALALILPVGMVLQSEKLPDPFARLTAFSIGFAFLVQSLWYIGVNFGIWTDMGNFVSYPFLDGGMLRNIVCGILLGIYCSAFARRELFPEVHLNKSRSSQKYPQNALIPTNGQNTE